MQIEYRQECGQNYVAMKLEAEEDYRTRMITCNTPSGLLRSDLRVIDG